MAKTGGKLGNVRKVKYKMEVISRLLGYNASPLAIQKGFIC